VRRVAEAGAIGNQKPLGSLDVHEVIERRLAEGRERHQDTGRKVAGPDRERRSPQMRCRPDRREQVIHQRQVQHFLERDLRQRTAPALDRRQFGRRHVFVQAALERPLGVQIRTHDRVLELGRFAQQVDELFAVLDDDVVGRS